MTHLHDASCDGEPVPPSQDEFGELLTRCGHGDEAAFARLYDLSSARVHGLVRRVLRDPAQSEEVTQEVYLEIWRLAPRFDPSRGSAVSWMLTIGHRRAVDRARAAQAQSDRDVAYAHRSGQVAHDSTAEQVEARMDAQRVRTAMAELTSNQREAVSLAFFNGFTHQEVAATLDVPLGTAKSRIRDGLIRLRDAIGVES